jgi:hypothetical protein
MSLADALIMELQGEVIQARTLTSEHLASRAPGAPQQTLVQLRTQHHRLAQALASGMRPAMAAVACGFSSSRISILQADPTFRDLVEYYQTNQAMEFQEFAKARAETAELAVEVLRERLEAEPEKFANRDLVDIVETLGGSVGTGQGQGHAPPAISITFVSPGQASAPTIPGALAQEDQS